MMGKVMEKGQFVKEKKAKKESQPVMDWDSLLS